MTSTLIVSSKGFPKNRKNNICTFTIESSLTIILKRQQNGNKSLKEDSESLKKPLCYTIWLIKKKIIIK
jgi:cytochrome c